MIQYIKRTCLQFEIEQFEAIEFITKRDQERILMETEERELPEGYSIGYYWEFYKLRQLHYNVFQL